MIGSPHESESRSESSAHDENAVDGIAPALNVAHRSDLIFVTVSCVSPLA